MSNFTDFGSGGIKSIQRGVANFPNSGSAVLDITISAVDVSKSVLMHLGTAAGNDDVRLLVKMSLENSTTIRVQAGSNTAISSTNWQLVEYT